MPHDPILFSPTPFCRRQTPQALLRRNNNMADLAFYPTFRPPFLSREKALLQNALLLRPSPWHSPFGAGEISLIPLPEAPSFSPACVLDVEIDGTKWQASFDSTAMLLRHEAFADATGQPPTFDERTLPEEVRRALMESLLEPVLSALQSSLGRHVSIQNAAFGQASAKTAFSAGFKASFSACNGLPELTTFVCLSPLQGESVEVLTGALKGLSVRHDGPLKEALKTVPLEVALESGYLYMGHEEVATLEVEDVLLPEVWTAPETLTLHLRREYAPGLTASCTVNGNSVTLASPLSEEPDASMDNSEINDIDIRLSFELDRRVITVGELEALTPGYTFSLNGDMTSPVTIRANGKAIARGRLVDMDGTLGVQIAETL